MSPHKSRAFAGNSIHPYIAECPAKYECALWRTVNYGSHDLVLGEVQQVHIEGTKRVLSLVFYVTHTPTYVARGL